jgi:uncharacterized protein involved in exopolysaccharide biosynthesis
MSGAGKVVSADGAELIDLGQGKLWLGFILRSLKRHKKRAILVMSAMTLLAGLSALSAPKQWASGMQIVAKSDSSAFAAVDPTKNVARVPALLAESNIKAQANLESIVDELGLDKSVIAEGPIVKAKRKLFEKVFGAADPTKKREDTIAELRSALSVRFDDRELIKQNIFVDIIWKDPIEAKTILDKVSANYIAGRRIDDLAAEQLGRDTLKNELKKVEGLVATLRQDLGIPEDDSLPIPESSPLRPLLTKQAELQGLYITANLREQVAQQDYKLNTKIVSPAEVPKAPLSGSLKTIIAGLMAGAMLAAFVTAATDLSRGKVVEPWQVVNGLNLPLLAQLPK